MEVLESLLPYALEEFSILSRPRQNFSDVVGCMWDLGDAADGEHRVHQPSFFDAKGGIGFNPQGLDYDGMNDGLDLSHQRPSKRRRIDAIDHVSPQCRSAAHDRQRSSAVSTPSASRSTLDTPPSSYTYHYEETDISTTDRNHVQTDAYAYSESCWWTCSDEHVEKLQDISEYGEDANVVVDGCSKPSVIQDSSPGACPLRSVSHIVQLEGWLKSKSEDKTNSWRSEPAELICFGMLRSLPVSAVALDSSYRFSRTTPVTLQGSLVLTADDSPRHIGNLDDLTAEVLVTLSLQSGFVLQCRASLKQCAHARTDRAPFVTKQTPIELAVILYGPTECFEEVGNFLLKCNLYLQDPDGCDLVVRYRNPQSLWGMDDNEVRMTQTAVPDTKRDFESFHNPSDLLKGLEYAQELSEASQPSALKTVLHR